MNEFYFLESFTEGGTYPYTTRNAYMQIVSQTYEEKVTMYKKLSKKKLIEMLMACNEALEALSV